jgi:hypothetical protein
LTVLLDDSDCGRLPPEGSETCNANADGAIRSDATIRFKNKRTPQPSCSVPLVSIANAVKRPFLSEADEQHAPD